jgi:putative glycosyltransferase (TIGR04372 family)
MYVLTTPFVLILRCLKIKFFNVNQQRIGHLCGDAGSYIKERIIKQEKNTQKTYVVLNEKKIANKYLIKYFSPYKEHLSFIEKNKFSWALYYLSRNKIIQENTSRFSETYDASETLLIQNKWEGRLPLFKLDQGDIDLGLQFLSTLGMSESDWYVCIHARESGYSGGSDFEQGFRNTNIDTLNKAIDEIISRGGWCIRMGNPTMKPLRKREKLIDYAHFENKQSWIDIYLCAKARLYLGDSAGLHLVSAFFGIPVAIFNMTPLTTIFPYGAKDIGIAKLYKDIQTGKLLNFKEILNSKLGSCRTNEISSKYGVQVIDNDSDEIRDLLIEGLDRIEGKYYVSDEDEKLQHAFRAMLSGNDYSYWSKSRVGNAFIKKYKFLLR